MYLKSLELLGFKSFAQKTTLNFHRGVTAIVGPNGCGKSNVLDAIRWVLGEQSAKALRGGEMADVIFSGTDSRAALGMAEVSLTFAECEKELGVEWNEVCVTRRVFRDGNSEYQLNKTPCRLRDIHQLFMDTGIGRTAYSIMEQGKIDLILSSKPEDRRAIFEEAAGITKYKSQKREALRKLEYTEANLLRVGDIIKEVKRQIGSLQRQAGKARRYQALARDLKTLETHHSRHQFEQLDASISDARDEIERLQTSQQGLEEDIEKQESDMAAQRSGIDELESKLSAARQVVNDFKNHISNAEHRIGFNRERVEELGGLIERYRLDIAAAEEKLRLQETAIHNADLELAQIHETLQFEQTRLEEKQAATSELSARRVETENSLQGVFGFMAQAENRLQSLRLEIGSLTAGRDGSETRLTILKDEIEQLDAASRGLADQRAVCNAEIERDTALLEQAKTAISDADASVTQLQCELEKTKGEVAAEERKLAELESKLEVLRQLNEAGEGFNQGTQAVLRGLDNPNFFKPAIVGALASHIEVEPKYIPAIEAALGQNLQAIVIKDSLVAESIVKTLNAGKNGRVTLALREFFEKHTSDKSHALPAGALGWALDKVRVNLPEVESLLRLLLNNTALVDSLETAIELARREEVGLTFASLSGEIVSAGGIVQGGQGGESAASMLQRKAQITALEAGSSQVRGHLETLVARRTQISQQLDTAQAKLGERRDEVQRINLLLSTARGQLSLLDREAQEAGGKRESLLREKEAVENRLREAGERLLLLDGESNSVTEKISETQSRQTEFQNALEAHRRQEEEHAAELNELRIKVATEKQRYNSLNNQRQPMAARLEELRELISERKHDIGKHEARSSQLAEESTRIESEIETTRGRVTEAEQEVAGLLEQRSRKISALEELENTLRTLRRQLSELHDRRGQHEVKQTQIQLRIENLSEHVMRRYQLDIREFQSDSYTLLCTLRDQRKRKLKAEVSDDIEDATEPSNASTESESESSSEQVDWKQIEQLVHEMSQKLDSMGPINVDAIQEYDELEQRYKFLENQFNDLTNSKAELLDVIAKINQTTKTMFADTFEQIRLNFREMFVELFGGGKANLLLLDESDPLESGIDIIAKPPGKQLQSISLLSGGERTMTAVALLFSIYMVKPSPFCVLDEMDAPLDESNINRFIKILDRFVSQSQFVVITHNKRTIAKADVLYGVTMEEHGVSKLVGVRFAKREESTSRTDIIGTANPAASQVPSIAESFGKNDELASEKLQAG
jgi:chromosome segregation protein